MKILVTGSNGLLGNALKELHFNDCEFIDRSFGDLTKEESVIKLYSVYRPDIIIHTAAKVGGIKANMSQFADFYYQNIMMNNLMIHYAHEFEVKRFIAFSSVCAFDANVEVLIEDEQQNGFPHPTNFAYAYAKRMIDIQMQAYRQKSKTLYSNIIPANLYGPHDQFDLINGHVIPCLIHKCYLAKQNQNAFKIWGAGTAEREFLLSSDLANVVKLVIENNIDFDNMIVSDSKSISIRNIAFAISEAMDYRGEIIFDANEITGQTKRRTDTTKFKNILPDFNFTNYKYGIQKTVEWFIDTYPNIRK